MLAGTFYASAGETGAVVGSVSVEVGLTASGTLTAANGSALGEISFTPVIKQAVVTASQTVPFLSTTQLTATAYDVNNNPVVVTPGSFIWSQSTGSSFFTLGADGTATPVANGTGTVTAAIDGLTSAAASVAVVPVNYTASAFAYDPTRSCVYVAAYNPANQAAILKISTVTGQVVNAITATSVQSLLTVSTDGTSMYSISSTGTISQINLTSFAIVGATTLPSGDVGVTVATLPSAPNTWLVATRDSNFDDAGTYVYDGLTARANSADIGLSIAVSADGSTAYGYQYLTIFGGGVSRNYSTASITSTGLATTLSVVSPFQGTTTEIHYCDNLILADDGSVLTPSTGALITTLGVTEAGHTASGSATGARAYVVQFPPNQILSFDLGSDSLVNTYTLPSTVSGNLEFATYAGSGVLAFRNSAGTTNQFYLTIGLP
jgi:hypothetical protein